MVFYPISADYEVRNGEVIIIIEGKDENGKKVVFEDDKYEPYFYAIPEQNKIEEVIRKLKEIEVEHKGEKIKIKRIEIEEKIEGGEKCKVLKIVCNLPRDIDLLKERVRNTQGILHKREFDLPFAKKYCLDKNIHFFNAYEIREGKLIRSEGKFNYNALSFDIEIYDSRNLSALDNKVIAISLYGKDIEKVLTWQKTDFEKAEVFKNEKEMIEKFFEYIKKYDVVYSYNGDDFDLRFLRERCEELKIKNPIVLGRGGVKIKGCVHIDLLKLVSSHLQQELRAPSMKLNDVALNLIGEGKEEFNIRNSKEIWEFGKIDDLLKYNLQDAKITFLLGQKLLPLEIEFCSLLNLELFEVTRRGYSQLVEWYLMKKAKQKGILIPNRPSNEEIEERKKFSYVGGYVHEPKPGLYENLANLDFRSLYPSIIVTFNISPDTLVKEEEIKEVYEVNVNGSTYKFRKDREGFISSILGYLIEKRQKLKKEGNKLAEKAIKTLANATYGYMGFFGARWYCKECAESITSIGRKFIKEVIESAEKEGLKVIYGDTDGIYVSFKEKERVKAFVEKMNRKLPGILELELKGFYKRGLFVGEKGKGKKKKYALIDEEDNIIIKGFEYVRGDWSRIAKKTQEKVLEYVLKGEEKKAVEFVKEVIEKIKKKEIEKDDLIIYRRITRDLLRYEQNAPHVAVARKLREKGIKIRSGTIIPYIITSSGESIREKACFAEEAKDYDEKYYIYHQVIPAALRILSVLGYSEKDLISEQESLKKWF